MTTRKLMIVLTVTTFLLALSATALANNGNGNGGGNGGSGEQGSSNGQPFLTLTAYIDEIKADLEDQINDLQAQIDANDGDIEQLMDELEALELALDELEDTIDELEDTIDDASCPPGYAIRSIDPLACEYDNVINDRLQVIRRFTGRAVFVPRLRYRSALAVCPAGWVATGCGHSVTPNVINTLSYPTNSRTCLARGFGRLGSGSIRAFANCSRAAPSP